MSTVRIVDTVTEWSQMNICDQIQLKQPPMDENAPDDSGYDYKLVTPAAFPMYVPSTEKLPPNVHSPFPSLCVRLLNGDRSMASGGGGVNIQLCFSAWNPGTHGRDNFVANADGSYSRVSEAEAKKQFKRTGEGWRDVWNFVDIALRALENTTEIGGYLIDPNTPIEFGPLTEQESIPDFYPFWFAWVSFRIVHPLKRNVQDFKNFL